MAGRADKFHLRSDGESSANEALRQTDSRRVSSMGRWMDGALRVSREKTPASWRMPNRRFDLERRNLEMMTTPLFPGWLYWTVGGIILALLLSVAVVEWYDWKNR